MTICALVIKFIETSVWLETLWLIPLWLLLKMHGFHLLVVTGSRL